MKKIGLVTYYKNNYGSALQCYATKTAIKKMGYSCELLIDINKKTDKIYHKIKRAEFLIPRFIFVKGYKKAIIEQKNMLKNVSNKQSMLTQESSKKIQCFIDTVLQPRECSDIVLKKIGKEKNYVAFIAGSDQIWSGAWPVNPFYFLDFAPKDKKIAFSASIGTDKIEKFNYKDFKKGIGSFRKVSLREASAVKTVEKQLGIKAENTYDPTVLLNKEEWEKFSSDKNIPDQKYIFAHFLDEPNETAIQTIKYLSQKDKMQVIVFAYYHHKFSDLENVKFIDGDPRDYVGLISKASYVCTDSFHTTVMSIYIKNNFFVFDRQYKHGKSQISRINTILEHYKCKQRLIDSFEKEKIKKMCLNTNFDRLDYILGLDRNKNFNYLRDSISEIESENDVSEEFEKIHLKDEECTGCGACIAACGRNAIKFKVDGTLTSKPIIDKNKCVLCKKCEKVCEGQVHRNMEKRYTKKAYIAYNLDDKLRENSASGGMFSAIANNYLKTDGLVCGAAYCINEKNDTIELKHKIISNIDELLPLLKSKYVQSNCVDVYEPIKKALKAQKKVLFCGTSCQVDGLYRYLENFNCPYDKLLTIDLICHGTPDREMFKNYILILEKKYGGKIIDFSFRNKENGKSSYVITFKIIDKEKTVRKIKIPMEKSSYYRFFMEYENYRENCYYCKFSSIYKPADLTIGDYFEAVDQYPELFGEYGKLEKIKDISCIVVHSKKGEDILNICKDVIYKYPVNINDVQASHQELCSPHMYTGDRIKLLKYYKKEKAAGIEKYFEKREKFYKTSKKIKNILHI